MNAHALFGPVRIGLPLLLLAGCGDMWSITREKQLARPAGTMDNLASFSPHSQSPALEGTVGSVSYIQGRRLMRVRGYGLVTGLGDRGSRNCRPSAREQIAREIRRVNSANLHATNRPEPDALINSLDTAVVEVFAEIPAGAAKGRTFDVVVRVEDPDTKSLAGGYLLSCELKIYQEVSSAETVEGRTHAKAEGPIFINPFTSGSDAGGASPREGVVIGGGVNQIDRRLTLVSTIESYMTVRNIMDAINRRFDADPKVADAVSPTNVDLRIPPQYRADPVRFLDLIMHLPLSPSPVVREARIKLLVAELSRPDAPLDNVGLALECMGTSIIPLVRPLYADPRRMVNFHAARTGLRLGDDLALDVIARHANDVQSPFRTPAIREMGDCASRSRAAAALHDLLENSDPRIRVAAYEAVRKVDRRSVARLVVGRRRPNFILEVIPSDGPAMIYARRSGVRRLALIGGDRMQLQPPLLYAMAGQPITLRAESGENAVSLLRKDVGGGMLRPIAGPLNVASLVKFMGDDLATESDGRLQGLGLDYAIILDVLYRLCEKRAITADFRWEEPTVEDLVGPLQPMGRPESEL